MTIQYAFLNVPELEEISLPSECLCPVCGKANLTPFKVYTCQDVLCGECWQKSAFNLEGKDNKCLKCDTPTELLCFRDYNRFLGFNLMNGDLMIATYEIKAKLYTSAKEKEPRERGIDALNQHEKHVLIEFLEQAKFGRKRRKARRAAAVIEATDVAEGTKRTKFLTNQNTRQKWL